MPTVQDILDRKGTKIVTVSPDGTVQDAASKMQAERIGAVLVLADNHEMLGIFTERDMLHRVVAQRELCPSVTWCAISAATAPRRWTSKSPPS